MHGEEERRIELAKRHAGDMVTIPIPLVDRGRGDPRNILGRVLHCNDNDLYTIAIKSGILKENFSRNQFILCPNALMKELV